MNKFLIATLAIAMTAPNLSATTMPLNHAEPIEAVEINILKVEQMFPMGEAPMTYLDYNEDTEYPECVLTAKTAIRAKIEAEETVARKKAVNYGSSKKTTAVKKATPGKLTVEATAYTHTGEQTATGTWPEAGRTIATDPRVIPSGTHVLINGVEYIAEDTGGDIKGNKIDIFMDSEAECTDFGRQKNFEIEVLE